MHDNIANAEILQAYFIFDLCEHVSIEIIFRFVILFDILYTNGDFLKKKGERFDLYVFLKICF